MPPVGPDGNPIPGQPPGKPGEPAKPEAPKTTARPTTPEAPANPEELKVVPDENGKVRFNFQGQPWRGVLEWLARISDLSLDWQELPADFLNLRTQRSYSLDEARDVINRHLLDRGFTMLKHGEILTVVNVKKIDPSLVPRVTPEALDERDPHEFVKVSFPLDSLTAETAKDELLPMMSPNGKLSPMKATNRIEAMDAAVNLREVRDMLAHEQSHRGRKRVVQEFKLEYTRASEVLDQLYELLGIEKKPAAAGPQNPQQMQQQMMMEQQMAQQMAQQGGNAARPPKQGSQVHMIANVRENSIVAQAPADQMSLIAEGVKLIDIPSARSQSLLKNMSRTQVYRLAAIDPEPLVKLLNELGDLDPTTRLQVDKKNRSIIAYGPLADHMTIGTLVKKLDGTDRQFEVIKLRRLEADYVAGSIEFMMGAGEKKKQQTNRYNPYFDFGFGGGRNNEEDESRKFRVDADIEHNRLLLWANPIEIEEINHLLVKLGEIPSEGGNLSTLRVLDSIPPEEVEELLQRLKRTWPGHGGNPLLIVPQTEPEASDSPARSANPIKKPARKRVEDGTTTQRNPQRKSGETPLTEARLLRLLQVARVDEEEVDDTDEGDDPAPARGKSLQQKSSPARADGPRTDDTLTDDGGADNTAKDADNEIGAAEKGDASEPAAGAPGRRRGGKAEVPEPIRVGRGPDGRLIISSADTRALDRMEDLLTEITPPRKDYKVFKLKYKSTWAYGVALNLKDFFKEKEDNKQDNSRSRFFYGYMPNSNSTDDTHRLSKRKTLKFISDSDSNSIIVTGADPAQLKTIEDLIAIYDIPESKDSAAVRKTELVQIHYSKAKVIADAVKDVYRDLLSANDPALQNKNANDNNKQKTTERYFFDYGGEEDKKPDTPMKFKGLLSIGVDELSNTLVVSAADGLVDNVIETIEALDEAAKPAVNRMRVLKVNRHIDADELQKRLKSLVTKPVPPQPQHPQNQNPNQVQNQNQAQVSE